MILIVQSTRVVERGMLVTPDLSCRNIDYGWIGTQVGTDNDGYTLVTLLAAALHCWTIKNGTSDQGPPQPQWKKRAFSWYSCLQFAVFFD